MSSLHYLLQTVGAVFAALLLCASPALAQTAGSTTTSKASGSSKAGSARVSKDDQGMMQDLAQANLAEIETGKMALDKARSSIVKKFAHQMINDHTTALKELQALAQSKGVSLSQETDVQHNAIATALKALSGETFDNQYLARVGVGDHERTRDLLQKVQKNAKDPDLKAYARKTLPIVEEHLSMAKKITGKQ